MGILQKVKNYFSKPMPANIRAVVISTLFLLSVTNVNGEDKPAKTSSSPASVNLTPQILETQNAIIGNIIIENQNVFDLDNPLEDRWLYRAANFLHIRTRPKVIRRQLLFREGDTYSLRDTEESARILRGNPYIGDAAIEPVNYKDGIVDLKVKTRDVWTLGVGTSFGRKGGKNSGGFGIEEDNLLGTGTSIAANYKSTVDRDVKMLSLANKHLGGSLYEAAITFADNSDGFERFIRFGKPFFSLDSRESIGGYVLSSRRIDSLYDRGDTISEFDHKLKNYEMNIGWSKGLIGGWTRRLSTGIVYEDHRFRATPDTLSESLIPGDREYLFPFLDLEIIEDNYETVSNFNQINETEDLHLGARFKIKIGYSNESVTSSDSGFHFNSALSKGLQLGETNTILFGWQLGGRLMSGKSEDIRVSTQTNYHWRQSSHRMFYAGLKGTVGKKLDLDNQLLLGGDSGLRGYPLRYQGGNASALLTLEQRVYTDWYPFRLFRVGGAVFFDAGRTWGSNPVGAENLGLLKDVGIGLRIGNSRSGIGRMIHVDLAFPLDGESDIKGVQLVIDSKIGF
jgi:outer membrane protein assembly factor BamA